jgi:hypothetical protein
MGGMRYVSLTPCTLSIVARAQENPLEWFPRQVGSRWIYEHEWKSGDRNQPSVDRWTSEETITVWLTGPPVGNGDVRLSLEPARPGVASFLPAEYAGAIHIFSGHFGSNSDLGVYQALGESKPASRSC